MKSLNVKKVAAAAAGAALIGAAALGAVDMNAGDLAGFNFFAGGEPNVKIVLGSKAQPSDAVVAAKLAATIGNLAWTYEDVTVLNTDLLECTGGGTGGSGKVTATVTTPGVNSAVAYQMKCYVEGYLDYDTTDDRADDWGQTGQTTILPMSSSSTGYAGRRVTSFENSQLVNTVTVSDSKAGKSYKEEEKYYMYGKATYDTSDKRLEGQTTRIGYEATFTDPVVVCTNATPSATTCATQYLTDRHNLKMKFLGADWVIYGLDNFDYNGGSTGGVTWTSTPMVTLGKSVAYQPYMSIGDKATTPDGLEIVLEDISGVGLGTVQQPKVTFKIYNADGEEIDTAILQPGSGGSGDEYNDNGIIVKLFDATTGQAGTSNAEVQIFSTKLELTHGLKVNDANSGWVVNVIGGGSTFGASLKSVQMSNIADQPYLAAGESMNVIKDPAAMKLTFTGLDEEGITVDTLTASLQANMYLPTTSTDATTKCNAINLMTSRTNGFNFGSDSSDRAYLCIASVAGSAKLGSIFYYKNSVYQWYNDTAATVNVTIPTGTVVTMTGGGNWTMNVTGVAGGTGAGGGGNNCSNMSASVTAFSGTTTLAIDKTNSTENVINAAGTAVTLYNEPGVGGSIVYYLAANAGITNGTTSYTCNNTINISISGTGTGISANGTITGFTLSTFLTNYLTYNYGPNTMKIGFNSTNVENGDISSVIPHQDVNPVLFVPEYTTTTDGGLKAFRFAVGDADGSTPAFIPSSGSYLGRYGDYALPVQGATQSGAKNQTGTSVADQFISWRGSKLTGSATSMTVSYPTHVKQAVWTLSTSGAETAGNTADVTKGVGDFLLDEAGYKIEVKSITTASGGNCDLAGADQLAPSTDKAYVVTQLDTTSDPLVVLDYQPQTKPLIVVGGQAVNTVAAQLLSGSAAITSSTTPMVKVFGDKIVVAGWAAADTAQAGDSLNTWLIENGAQLH